MKVMEPASLALSGAGPSARAGVHPPIRTAIAVQGWTCDRTPGGMAGAPFLAERAAERFGLGLRKVGTPGPVADLGWRDALGRAGPTLNAAADAVREELAANATPLLFLNRCGTSLATLPPLLAAHPEAVLIWVDAHGDYNTPETTLTGYLGGMVVSGLAGLWQSGHGAGLTPQRTLLVGTRDLDPREEDLLGRDGITIIAGRGFDLATSRVADFLAGRPAILHIDLDVLDPVHFPAEYAIPGGLHPAALRRLVRVVSASARIVGVELSEFDLPVDPDHAELAAATVATVIEPLLEGKPAG